MRRSFVLVFLALSLGIAGITYADPSAASGANQSALPFTGLTAPGGVAVDGAGDVFVADTGNNQVVELPAGSSTQQVLPFTGLTAPGGVAVDSAGDVFVADTGNNQVVELPAGSTTQQTLSFTGLAAPGGIAVDVAGDVFVADTGNNRILELPPGSTTQQVLPFTGLTAPAGVAVDAAGDAFTADTGNNRVLDLSGYVATTTTITSVTPSVPAAGKPFAVNVSVTAASGALSPGGQVTVSDGGSGSCSLTLGAEQGGQAGTSTGSCQLTEASGGSYTLTANYAGHGAFGTSAGTASVTVGAPPAFVQETPPLQAAADQPYSYTFSATGTPAPSYSLASPAPPWLSINGSTGALSGSVPAGIASFTYSVTAANPAGTTTAGPFTIKVTGTAGPYVTLLFSRTEMTAADGCVANSNGIAPLDTVVAPYLKSLGMTATGTLETGPMQPTARFCTHNQDTLSASWADAANLAGNFGWSFGSHTATYPSNINNLTPAQSEAQTCSSAAAIDAHGLPGGHGIIAYPAEQRSPVALQTNYSANCFAWGRKFGKFTSSTAGSAPPYWQYTLALNGGACTTPSAPCYTVTSTNSARYSSPSTIIAEVMALKPGQWFTLQAFILVTGTSPPYVHNKTKWDCTSPNPSLHWTNDNERYCYSDWQQIVAAIAALPHVIVTDPLSVGVAFGRPMTYQGTDASVGVIQHGRERSLRLHEAIGPGHHDRPVERPYLV